MIECYEFKATRDGIFIDGELLDRYVVGIRYDCKIEFDIVTIVCYVMSPVNEKNVLVVDNEDVTEELFYFWKRS